MDILNRINKNLKIVLDNKIEEQAIENAFLACFCHLVQLKNITFTSIKNLKIPHQPTYYAINFCCSGGKKNQAISHINECLLSFINDEYRRINNRVREQVIEKEISKLNSDDKNYTYKKHEIEKENADKVYLTFKTNGGTPAAIYDDAKMISDYRMGALFAQITEFGDYFRSSLDSGNNVNKAFLDMLNNLYDGTIEASTSLGCKRTELKNIPFSLLFLSDIQELLNDKNNIAFKNRLKSGFARRVNFYIDKNINYAKNPPEKPTKEEKLEAYTEMKHIETELVYIYQNLYEGSNFVFSAEADDFIEQWESQCEKEASKFYQYTDTLSIDDKIKEIEISNSTWKICKMAVLMQILMFEKTLTVSKQAVMEAIAFYAQCRKSLYSILAEKAITEEENMCNYFINNQNREINKTELKAQNFVSRGNFPNWFKTSIQEVANLLAEKGFTLVSKKERKSEKFMCIKGNMEENKEDTKDFVREMFERR